MRVTDEMVELACNAYDTYNRSRNQILLRGVATGGGMKAALEAAIQAAWIKLDMSNPDGRPKLKQDVLVVTDSGRIFKSSLGERYTGCRTKTLAWEGFYWLDDFKPTHWMPLPEFKEHS